MEIGGVLTDECVGTLSPMEAFREDLKIPFSVFLENPHVIRSALTLLAALCADTST